MSASEEGFDDSLWGGPETNENAPKRCPICDRALAHPDDLRDNDNIRARGLFRAYREHRQAHYGWGKDPRDDGERYGDPYLGNYYDGDKDATFEPDEDEPAGDPDEEVASVYDVEVNYEAVLRARVVATNESQAKDRAQMLRKEGKDLTGSIPEAHITHEVHDTTREVKTLTRGEISESEDVDESEDEGVNYAERLPGWPW